MAMNKVVHAAQRAAFSVAIDATINAVRGKGPENMAEQAVKLVNLAQPLLAKRYPDANWDAVRAFVSDPNSKWMQYAYRAINEIDPHILKMNALNLVYEGCSLVITTSWNCAKSTIATCRGFCCLTPPPPATCTAKAAGLPSTATA